MLANERDTKFIESLLSKHAPILCLSLVFWQTWALETTVKAIV